MSKVGRQIYLNKEEIHHIRACLEDRLEKLSDDISGYNDEIASYEHNEDYYIEMWGQECLTDVRKTTREAIDLSVQEKVLLERTIRKMRA